jgi:hypothetical protein
MTGVGRALLGAAVGAVLTLVIHPLSRPFLATVFERRSPEDLSFVTHYEGRDRQALAQPKTQEDRSLWMQIAAQRIRERDAFTMAEWKSLLKVARDGAANQPDNAFWRQMASVFLHEMKRDSEALNEWERASRCRIWNDLQTPRMMKLRSDIAATVGVVQSWQLAYVMLCRTPYAASEIEGFSRWVVGRADLQSEEGLALRYATFVNGALMRDGAKSLLNGAVGASIVEIASHPPELRSTSSIKKLLMARLYFQRQLAAVGKEGWSDEVYKGYGSNDGWLALTQLDDTDAHKDEVILGSLVTATLPSMFLSLSLMGGVFYLLGVVLAYNIGGKARLKPVTAAALGSSAGIGVYLVTLLPLAGVATLACFLFLIYSPKYERTRATQGLGPLFDFMLIVLGSAFALSFGIFLVGFSPPAVSLLPVLSVPREYYAGSVLFAGLSAILLAMLLLVAPIWAIAQRVGTPYVLAVMFKRFGAFLGLSCLALVVLGTPLAVYFDRKAGDTLQKLVENEPIYYLTRSR